MTYKLIKEAAVKAVKKKVEPYKVCSPVTMKVEFTSPEKGNAASMVLGIELLNRG